MKIKNILKSCIGLTLAVALTLSAAACSKTETPSGADAGADNNAAGTNTSEPADNGGSDYDTITVTWYPNESAADYEPARQEFGKLIEEATGKKVEHKLTTDYAIAIEALASGSAQICFMGAQGYVEAKNKNDKVMPLFVNSGASGTLDDAIYYSWLSVNKGQEDNYKKDGKFAIDNIKGKKISFVSNSSTSGFKVPTSNMISYFTKQDEYKDLTADDLVEGGSGKFFSEVLFGGSHQGSAVNLLSGKAEVAAFCDTELNPYSEVAEGEENKPGAVYEIKEGATAPFDTLVGKQFVVIQSTPVLNGPFAYNSEKLSADDVKKIQDKFLSDEAANNPQLFVTKDSGLVGMFKKTADEHFMLVEDEWYNPIRELSE